MARSWNPAYHPRDKRGRFTRSATRTMSAADKRRGKKALEGFNLRTFGDSGEARDYLEGLNPDSPPAVRKYLDEDWRDVNAALRAGKPADGVDEIDQAMTSLPDDLLLRRQVPLSLFAHVPMEELEGMKVRDAAYASTSLDVGPHAGGKDIVTMHILAPAGTQAHINAADGEILLARDTEMAITRVEPDGNGGWDVYGAILPKAKSRSKANPVQPNPPTGNEPSARPLDEPDPELPTPTTGPASDRDSEPQSPAAKPPGAPKKITVTPAGTVSARGSALAADLADTRDEGRPAVADKVRQLLDQYDLNGDETPQLRELTSLLYGPEGRVLTELEAVLRADNRSLSSTDFVDIAVLRDRLKDLDRATVDRALVSLYRSDGVYMTQNSIGGDVTPEQRAAALTMGNRPQHLVSLGGDSMVAVRAAIQALLDAGEGNPEA